MFHYETKTMTQEECEKFLKWFDQQIGTDREVNEDPEDPERSYVVCFELERNEVDQIRKYEHKG